MKLSQDALVRLVTRFLKCDHYTGACDYVKGLLKSFRGSAQVLCGTETPCTRCAVCTLVDGLVQAKEYPLAEMLCEEFGLQEKYGYLHILEKQEEIDRRILTGRLNDAASCCAGSEHLQLHLINELVRAGHRTQAGHYVKSFGLEERFPDVYGNGGGSDSCQLKYLSLPSNAEVVFADNTETIERFRSSLASAKVLGLDAEWRPSFMGGSGRPSILQVASEDAIFILDMVVLDNSASLTTVANGALSNAFASPDTKILGFGLSGDITALAHGYPGWQSFRECVENVCDFSKETAMCNLLAEKNAGSSLSSLAAAVVGLPLDKGEQISDWERRPLTPRQMAYAALDAYVLIMLHQCAIKKAMLFPSSCLDTPSILEIKSLGDYSQLSHGDVVEALESADAFNRGVSIYEYVDEILPQRSPEESAANQLGVPFGAMAKTIAFIADGTPVAVVAPGDDRVNIRSLQGALGLGRRQIRLATPDECTRVFGFPPGSMPAIGLRGGLSRVRMFVDEGLMEYEKVYPGAGQVRKYICLTPGLLLELAGGTLLRKPASADVATKPESVDKYTGQDGTQSKFLLDGMGKLTKWLRVGGWDAIEMPAGSGRCHSAIRNRAIAEGRVLLTTDRKLAQSRELRQANIASHVVVGSSVQQQLEDVRRQFNLGDTPPSTFPPRRCVKCNSNMFHILDKADAAGKVPPKTLEVFSSFAECTGCAQVFWHSEIYAKASSGSH